MSAKPFHLGWFTTYKTPEWRSQWAGDSGRTWTDGEFYIDMAKAMERASFDFIMLEDSEVIPDAYAGNMTVALKLAVGPRMDPIPLVAAMARETSKLGLVATMTTSFYPPFILARAMSTLDHMTHGRVGWNIVTSSEDRAAQNFGMEKLYEHDERYDRAEEFTELVGALWDSWDSDAVVVEGDTYVDGSKVRVVDYKGKYYSSRGPLNTLPGPQGRPIICQAGSSERGRQFAAKHAEIILAVPTGLERMKAFRDDIRRRMEQDYGRDPDSCKILFICEPVLGETDEEAMAKWHRMNEPTDENVLNGLIGMSTVTDIDFSQFDLDAPLPTNLDTNGHQSSLKNFYTYGNTLREIAMRWLYHYGDETLVGTPSTVAARMEEIMESVGGDGFLMHGPMTRRFISEVTDGLVPELQRRGRVRKGYEHNTFRENLLAF